MSLNVNPSSTAHLVREAKLVNVIHPFDWRVWNEMRDGKGEAVLNLYEQEMRALKKLHHISSRISEQRRALIHGKGEKERKEEKSTTKKDGGEEIWSEEKIWRAESRVERERNSGWKSLRPYLRITFMNFSWWWVKYSLSVISQV